MAKSTKSLTSFRGATFNNPPINFFQVFDRKIAESISIPSHIVGPEDLFPDNIPAQRRSYQDMIGKWATPIDPDYYYEPLHKKMAAVNSSKWSGSYYDHGVAPKRHCWYHTLLWVFMLHKHTKNADLDAKEGNTSPPVAQE